MTTGHAVEGRQEAVFAYVRDYYGRTGVPPTTREVTEGLGLSGPSVAFYHLGQLVRAGSLKKVGRKYIPLSMVGIDELASTSKAACPWEGLAHDFAVLDPATVYCRKCGTAQRIKVTESAPVVEAVADDGWDPRRSGLGY